VDMVGTRNAVTKNGIAKDGRGCIGSKQQGRRPPVVKVEISHQHPQRITDRRGMPHQLANRTHSTQIETLPDQKSEMVATGQARAGFRQPAHGFEGKTVVGILKQLQIDASLDERHFPIHSTRD